MISSLRRLNLRFPLISFYLAIFMVAPSHPAQAAVTYAYSALSDGCKNSYTTAAYGFRYIITRTSRIIAITAQIGNASSVNFNTSTYTIRPDNAGTPGAIAATFSPSTVSGGLARYTGSYTVLSGNKYWITPGQGFINFPGCYGQPLVNSDLTTDGSINVDSLTGLASVYYTSSDAAAINWGAGTTGNFLFQLGIETSGTDTSTITISGISPNSSPLVYKSVYTLTATLSTPGKTTFYAQGKTIAGCKNIKTTSTTATCTWKPATHGAVQVYAALRPTDISLNASTSPVRSFGVAARSGNR